MAERGRRLVGAGRFAAPPRRRTRRVEADGGMVIVEAALAIPALLAVTMVLVWVVSLASTALALGDATRQAARDIARGVPVEQAVGDARGRAPGAVVDAVDQGTTVRVTAHVEVSAPVWRDLSVTVRDEVVVPKEWG